MAYMSYALCNDEWSYKMLWEYTAETLKPNGKEDIFKGKLSGRFDVQVSYMPFGNKELFNEYYLHSIFKLSI